MRPKRASESRAQLGGVFGAPSDRSWTNIGTGSDFGGRSIAGIVTYQSSWTPPFGEPLRDALAGLAADHQLDVGCALRQGAFELRYPAPGEVALSAVEGPRSLVQFLMCLLKQLQALATAPAIDYEAYLARFQRDGEASR